MDYRRSIYSYLRHCAILSGLISILSCTAHADFSAQQPGGLPTSTGGGDTDNDEVDDGVGGDIRDTVKTTKSPPFVGEFNQLSIDGSADPILVSP